MNNYFVYHLHSDYSSCTTNIDSATKVDMYVQRAKQLNMKALAFSEHGNILNWYEKKTKIEAAGMKYVHAIECYITEQIETKVRDNYHCVLIAKNFDGFKEINKLVTLSSNRKDGHFYYVPRITFEEFLNISDNIVVTSACLGGILHNGNELLQKSYIDYFVKNKDRCFLEIQHHQVNDQIEYNKKLYALSQEYGIRLIAGTDTHSLNSDLAEARIVLQRAKNTFFPSEDGWDLTFKSYDELVSSYISQNSIPLEAALEAIKNTNLIADMVEPFEVDTSPKYPELYENADELIRVEAYKAITEHPYALKNHSYIDIKNRVDYELEEFKKANMSSFMLFKKSINDWQHKNGIWQGPGRGSVTGSMIAYLFRITEMDSMKFNLNFFRFCNSYRVSNAD